MLQKAKEDIARFYSRDLCVMTKDEIQAKWSSLLPELRTVFEDDAFQLPEWHNPVYEVALQFWFDNNPALLYPPLHKWLCDEFLKYYFDNSYKFALILFLLPRNTFKSTFFHGAVPMFIHLREKHLNKRDIRLCLEHHKEEMAAARSALLKSKYQSHLHFRYIWDEFKMDGDDGTKTAWNFPGRVAGTMNEPSIFAIGTGGLKQGWHFDWRFPDDVVTEDHRDSETLREESLQKYLISRYVLDKQGKEVCSGTRYHLLDLWGKLITMETEQRTPMTKSYVRGAKEDGILLCPNRWDDESLERERQIEVSTTGGEYNYWCQLFNQPRKPEDQIFERKWFQTIPPKNPNLPKNCFKVVVVDPCWKDTATFARGDEASIQTWGIDRQRNFYRLDAFESNRMTNHDGIVEILNQMKNWRTPYVVAERIGQDSYINQLREEARRCHQSLILIDCMKDSLRKKGARIMGIQKYAQNGQVWLVCNCDVDRNGKHDAKCMHERFLKQIDNYPQVAHDDIIDAASYAFIEETIKHAPLSLGEDDHEESRHWHSPYRQPWQLSQRRREENYRPRVIKDKATGLSWQTPHL